MTSSNSLQSVGDRVQRRREELGWSQSELARRMKQRGWSNYRQMNVSRTEGNERMPRLDESIVLAEVLQTSFNHLVFGNSSPDEYGKGFKDGSDYVFQQIDLIREAS